ncbi:MAG TPA: PH domain-containing protein [Candidatus Paceibacterota bacterium]|nr:PH domain-containing protein [Candidatus Paceibacterota bacterium]
MIGFNSGEQVVVVIRKHWLPLVLRGAVLGLFALIPFLCAAFLPQEVFAPIMSYPGAQFVLMFFYSLWLLVLWMSFFVMWTNYYFDTWVLTSERIIDIDQVNLFHRQMVSAGLDRIQDAHVEVSGPLATFFCYGTLKIFTAGERPDIVIENAAHPYDAKERIVAAAKAMQTGAGKAQGV